MIDTTPPSVFAANDPTAPLASTPRRSWRFALALGLSLMATVLLAWPVGYFSSSAQLLVSLSAAAVGGGIVAAGLAAKWLRKPAASRYLAAGAVVLVFALAYPIHKAILHYEISRAQAYCERLQPGLEAHIRRHGSYPDDVAPLLPPSTRPRLLLEGFYVNMGTSYAFFITYPDSIGPEGYYYRSKHKTWVAYQ